MQDFFHVSFSDLHGLFKPLGNFCHECGWGWNPSNFCGYPSFLVVLGYPFRKGCGKRSQFDFAIWKFFQIFDHFHYCVSTYSCNLWIDEVLRWILLYDLLCFCSCQNEQVSAYQIHWVKLILTRPLENGWFNILCLDEYYKSQIMYAHFIHLPDNKSFEKNFVKPFH